MILNKFSLDKINILSFSVQRSIFPIFRKECTFLTCKLFRTKMFSILYVNIFNSGPFIWRHWTCPRPGSCWPHSAGRLVHVGAEPGGGREQLGQHWQPACSSIPTPLSTKLAGNYFWWQNEWLRRLWKKRTETQLLKKMQVSSFFRLRRLQHCIENVFWIEKTLFH